jgi:hypothetical protein
MRLEDMHLMRSLGESRYWRITTMISIGIAVRPAIRQVGLKRFMFCNISEMSVTSWELGWVGLLVWGGESGVEVVLCKVRVCYLRGSL